ncbi:agamous-like MADS-box protein AGL62 [Salvia miltiorrhiza]|uniref:agamous-like MADS-box protein AGL62 n=1 Tax=Salvia miltiorrhiza TaxID=226208 RepID=UPI0025AC8B25|nr:agamous-like MADS-box protein AGL62 [Salvia miltiorrhiza]
MSSSSKQAAGAAPRKSKGRQKVKMAKMENHSNLQVTFSKRRAGLFKKASELCTLCGAEAAIVVFSPANKVYCFGHPNVNTLVDRLAAGMEPPPPPSHLIMEAHRNSNIRDLNIELTRLDTLLRAERRRAQEIDLLRRAGHQQRSLDDLDHAQLCALKESVMEFKKSLDAKLHKEMFNSHPSGVGAGADDTCRFPGFDLPKLSLGFGHLLPYSNGGLPADYSTVNINGGGGAYYGWSNGASSSTLPNDPHAIATNMFQMF